MPVHVRYVYPKAYCPFLAHARACGDGPLWHIHERAAMGQRPAGAPVPRGALVINICVLIGRDHELAIYMHMHGVNAGGNGVGPNGGEVPSSN